LITKEILDELKNGSISFMIFAYPPGRAQMEQNDGGQAAMKRRKTMMPDNLEFNAEDYEKIMGSNE
jgi:hypothetical protein